MASESAGKTSKELINARYRHAKGLLKADPAQAIIEFKSLAEGGHAASMIHLGRAYCLGLGTRTDFVEAERWFRRSAELGNLFGHFSLGRLYLRLKRYREARETYAIPAAAEFGPALHDLGKIYLLGLGVEPDLEKAKSYFERAARAGNIFAKARLGRILIKQSDGLRSSLKGAALLVGALFALVRVLWSEGFDSLRLVE